MKNYFPSNGTEGMIFMNEFCDNCYKNNSCTILTNSFFGKQPKQWVYENDKPTCTSFCKERPKRIKKQLNIPKLF